MSKKINIIEINGKRYDAHTGDHLDHAHHEHHTEPIAVQHTRTSRQPAKPASRHKQQRSVTLMRKAVHKPSASLKRSIKAQGHTGTLVEQPSAEIVRAPSFGIPNTRRLQRASHIKKSHLITHFNPSQPTYTSTFSVPVTVKQPAAKPAPKTIERQTAPDIDAIFDRAIQQATSHLEPAHKPAKKRRLHLVRKHA